MAEQSATSTDPSNKPHICQLVHGLTVGGAERLAVALGRSIRDRYRVSFVCLDELGPMGPTVCDDGFHVELLNRSPGVNLRCARRLGSFLRRERVQLVHAHQYTPFFYALAARHFRPRPLVLFTEHGRWYPDYPRRKRIVFNRLFLRRHDRVIAVGQAVRRALIDNEGLSPTRVGVIYNGVDLTRFSGSADGRRSARQSLDLDDSAFVLLLVARLDYLKDHATAIRAMSRVVARVPQARLLLVGDGPERAAIETLINDRGLEDHVRLLGTRGDVPQLLPAADLFLLTSISEGIPLTVIEAMAARLPVVATDVGGVAEIVTPETGLLAAAGDEDQVAEHIIRLADAPALRASLGAAGCHRAAAQFGLRQMLNQYASLYDSMLA